MRMFLWTGRRRRSLKVNAPAPIAGVKTSDTAEFGPQAFDRDRATVVLALDAANTDGPTTTDGCTAFTNAAAVAGKIAVIDRGVCLFVEKAKNAQNAGAVGVVIFNNVTTGRARHVRRRPDDHDPGAVRVAGRRQRDQGRSSRSRAVSMRMARQSTLPRDGSFDNTLIAHEWGHYLSQPPHRRRQRP